MNQEKWLKWNPIEKIPSNLYLKEFKYNSNGLNLSLEQEEENSPILNIYFNGVFSFRSADEGDLLKTLSEREKTDNTNNWSLFTVENSLYLEWFHEQSYDIHKKDQIIHYLIATPNDVIDVLDSETPCVKWI
jgi:hypothetical protein